VLAGVTPILKFIGCHISTHATCRMRSLRIFNLYVLGISLPVIRIQLSGRYEKYKVVFNALVSTLARFLRKYSMCPSEFAVFNLRVTGPSPTVTP